MARSPRQYLNKEPSKRPAVPRPSDCSIIQFAVQDRFHGGAGDRGTAPTGGVGTQATGSCWLKQTGSSVKRLLECRRVVCSSTTLVADERTAGRGLDCRSNPLLLWQPPSSLVRRCFRPAINEELEVNWDRGPGTQRLQCTGTALRDDEVLGSTALKGHAAQMYLHGMASSCCNQQLHLRAPL